MWMNAAILVSMIVASFVRTPMGHINVHVLMALVFSQITPLAQVRENIRLQVSVKRYSRSFYFSMEKFMLIVESSFAFTSVGFASLGFVIGSRLSTMQ